MTTIAANKRRKTSTCSRNITDLPDNILADVGAYLPKPSRALFAAAMTASSSSWAKCNWKCQPSATSKAILLLSSEQWRSFDFGELGKQLANRLKDEDVGAILACINAANSLKVLKLTGCLNMTGRGLEPLRGSAVVEHIDLSLVGQHESSSIHPMPSISEHDVIPILHSIADAYQTSIKYLQLPNLWRCERHPLFHQFLIKYNRLLESRESSCSNCHELVSESYRHEINGWIFRHSNSYGLQTCTCYKCMEIFCSDCSNGGTIQGLCYCVQCNKKYCHSCGPVSHCFECGGTICAGCQKNIPINSCGDCGINFCKKCGPETRCPCWVGIRCNNCVPNHDMCENDACHKESCNDCHDDGENTVHYCEDCGKAFCSVCRFAECTKGKLTGGCPGCLALIAPKLAIDYDRQRLEIEELKNKLQKRP